MALSNTSTSGHSGRGVVVALILIGVAAGLIYMWYWQGDGRTVEPGPEPAGSVIWNRQAVENELAAIQERAQEALGQKRGGAVLPDARRFVDRYPRFAPGYLLLGQLLIAENQFSDAYDQFRLCLDLDASQDEVHSLAGTISMGLGDDEQAEHHYSQAVGLAPSNGSYRLHLCQCYIRQKRFDEARRDLTKLVAADSSQHDGLAMLADIALRENKLSVGMNYINRAIDATPLSDRNRQVIYLRRKATILSRQKRPDEAMQVLLTLSESERADPNVVEQVARCLEMRGRYAEAAMQYETALARSPTQWRLAAGAAHWWHKAQDRSKVKLNIERIRSIDPRLEVIGELEALLAAESAAKQPQ